jgi:MoxR-like ATPase
MTALVFAKVLTYFRGQRVVELDELLQILPFVLHDKLQPATDSPGFEAPGNSVLRIDRTSWIRRLFDLTCAEYDRLNLDHDDPAAQTDAQFRLRLEGLDEAGVRARLVKIERLLAEWSKGRKLYGNQFDDVLKLKYLHQRNTNYLRWLTYQ